MRGLGAALISVGAVSREWRGGCGWAVAVLGASSVLWSCCWRWVRVGVSFPVVVGAGRWLWKAVTFGAVLVTVRGQMWMCPGRQGRRGGAWRGTV